MIAIIWVTYVWLSDDEEDDDEEEDVDVDDELELELVEEVLSVCGVLEVDSVEVSDWVEDEVLVLVVGISVGDVTEALVEVVETTVAEVWEVGVA
jgi:hypothetical protein